MLDAVLELIKENVGEIERAKAQLKKVIGDQAKEDLASWQDKLAATPPNNSASTNRFAVAR